MDDMIPRKSVHDMRGKSDAPRITIPPHLSFQDGQVITVHGSCGCDVGEMVDRSTGQKIPTITLHHSTLPVSMVFVPTPEELRAFAETCLSMADEREKAAADLLAETLKRKPGV